MILSILVSLPVLGIFIIVCKPFFSNIHLLEKKDRLIKELNVSESIDNNKNNDPNTFTLKLTLMYFSLILVYFETYRLTGNPDK